MINTDLKSEADKKPKGKRILILEDEKAIANVLKIKLNSQGFDVDIVSNGIEGIEFLKSNRYDLVLTDLVMPEMNGFEFIEKAKQQGIMTPIVVTSNLSQDEDIKKAKGLGAIDYFVKSDVSLSQIVEFVYEIINRQTT